MQQETAWLGRILYELDEATRGSAWRLQDVQSYRGELAGVWNDRCAQDVGVRYLTPLADSSASALAELQQLLQRADACQAALHRSDEWLDAARASSAAVQARIAETHEALRPAHARMEEATNELNGVYGVLNSARGLLASAESGR